MIEVYIAAHTENQARAAALRASLRAHDIGCTSRWLDLVDPPRASAEGAETCWEDIARAEALLFLNPAEHHRSGTGGRHTEVGIALGLGKPVIVLGAPENVFHSTGWRTTHVPDDAGLEQLLITIRLAIASAHAMTKQQERRRGAVAFDLRRIGAAMLNGSRPSRSWNETTVGDLLIEAAEFVDGQTLLQAAAEAEQGV